MDQLKIYQFQMCQTKEIFAPWTYLSLIIKPNPLKNISILNIYGAKLRYNTLGTPIKI